MAGGSKQAGGKQAKGRAARIRLDRTGMADQEVVRAAGGGRQGGRAVRFGGRSLFTFNPVFCFLLDLLAVQTY